MIIAIFVKILDINVFPSKLPNKSATKFFGSEMTPPLEVSGGVPKCRLDSDLPLLS